MLGKKKDTGSKKEEKVVTFKEDKKAAEQRRLKALADIQRAGHKGKETRRGVADVPPRTKKGREQQAKLDQARKLADGRDFSIPDRKGKFRSEWD